MQLVLISGRSGSGKSSALNVLEDVGFNCIDNLPVTMLPMLMQEMKKAHIEPKVAVCIDARNALPALQQFPQLVQQLPTGIELRIVYLDAHNDTLYKRFSETRRKHPLTNDRVSLLEAIRQESELLDPILNMAHLNIDTTGLSLHQLRDHIKRTVMDSEDQSLSLQFLSFGYKHGIPHEADLVFDVRCLPNPYWDHTLRKFTGLDEPVQKFLYQEQAVLDMLESIQGFLEQWIPAYEANNRSYLTIAIGCTGGYHRSVYLVQQLAQLWRLKRKNVQTRHRELQGHTDAV
jgi:UPF0042 nucleotide-binding protein